MSVIKVLLTGLILLLTVDLGFGTAPDPRPNILLAIADDWSWPHASIAAEPVVRTPSFDRIARDGVLFRNAFVTAPTCTASRGALLTGQWPWRLGEGANLFGTLPARVAVYPDLLEKAGYHVGFSGKGWGPGNETAGGKTRNPAGKRYRDFAEFLKNRPTGRPFCFWFGSHDPHRPYAWKSGVQAGMDPGAVRVPACLPDAPDVRIDLCDYFAEVQKFDKDLGDIVARIQRDGELDRTLIAVTSDNGMPFPRCKANLYGGGTHVPLAIRWKSRITEPRVVDDLVSTIDLAPTFLEAAGLTPEAEMTGRSLLPLMASKPGGTGQSKVDPPPRDHVLLAMERHAWARPGGVGYPMRALRTKDFLYIRNFAPDRWPAGDASFPQGWPTTEFCDIDASPTKALLLARRADPAFRKLFDLACAQRPGEELYDLRTDPKELKNVAADPKYIEAQRRLAATLMAELKETQDPRTLGQGDAFDKFPFYGRKRAAP
jgi:arylsulfatase A-like enzyme